MRAIGHSQRPPVSSRSPISVLIADEQPVFRAGLRKTLEAYTDIDVVAEAASGEACLHEVMQHQPNVVILEIGFSDLSSLEVMQRLHQQSRNRRGRKTPRVLVLSARYDSKYVTEFMQAGATGFITKLEDGTQIVRHIRHVARGGRSMCQRALDNWGPPPPELDLTPRELEVLKLLASGHDNGVIAEALTVVLGTVKNYVTRIYNKIEVNSRAQAVAWAWQNGIMTA